MSVIVAVMIAARVCNADKARLKFGELADLSFNYLMEGDPLADAVVDAFSGLPKGEGHKQLELALAGGIASVQNAPSALVELFQSVQDTASINWKEIEAGQKALIRPGINAGIVLIAGALMADYWSPPFSKPLTLTGTLVENTAHRLLQTTAWWLEAHTPGGMRPEGEGFKTTLRVRVIHAHVRHMLGKSGLWKTENWGVPINQSDLLFQTAGFTYLAIRALRQMGHRLSREEQDGIYALWRHVGSVLGIHAELVKRINAQDMKQFWDLWFLTNPPPDNDCRALAKASIFAGETNSPWQRFLYRMIDAPLLSMYARNFLGGRVANKLGVGGRSIRWVLPVVIRPMVRLQEMFVLRSPASYERAVKKGLAVNVESLGEKRRLRGKFVSAPTHLKEGGRL